jgi:cytochrome c-type biogenesis protein CcmH
MTAFVVLCAVMALVAVFMVVYPLLRPMPAVERGEAPVPKATPLAFATAVTLAVGAAFLYANVSNFPWGNPITAQAVPAGHGQMGEGAASMEQAIIDLEDKLAKSPSDQEGWRMLGRTYLVSGNPDKAISAYERAMSLDSAPSMDMKLDLAEALVLAGQPQQQVRAKAIIDEALAADAASQKALWYRGVMAVRGGDNETAKTSWSALLEQNPPAEIRDILVAQLRELGADVPAAAAATGAAMGGMGAGMAAGAGMGGGETVAPKGRTIRVKVSIDPALASKLQPGAPLFVSAREPGIPGPPIAAVRLTSDQLPATVVLSDANTMIEGRDLSSVADVEVVARVAFSGTPAVASGDLLGSAVQAKGASEEVAVVIARVQP